MVLKDIAMFHNRHRRQPLFKCCKDHNRTKLPSQPIIPDVKEKHAATVSATTTDDSIDKYVFVTLTLTFSFKNYHSIDLEYQKTNIIVINHFHVHHQPPLTTINIV